ncbi:vWA domain-containing protein [Acaryochloris marina NIES-2412]|uniref:vWA domain-containing protein n=1 Tax=Acaryochloris marina TaxID=155978 RepID=UPI004059D441
MFTELKAELTPITTAVSETSKLFWQDYLKSSQAMVEVTSETNIKTLNSFALEVFHRLYYSPIPEWLPEKPEHQWARVLHNQLSESEEFQNLTLTCSGDPLGAAIAAQSMITNLHRQLKDASGDQEIDELDTLRAEARKAKRDGDEELFQQLQAQGQAMSEAAQAFAQKLEEMEGEGIGESVEDAEGEVQEKKDELEALGISWGNESGDRNPTPTAEKLKLAVLIEENPQLKKILDLAGNALETANRKCRQHQAEAGYGELVGITTGNDVSQILPQELGRLSDSRQKLSFYRDFLEGQLFQNDLQAPEEKGKGPMVICLDCSGSMKERVSRDLWSKALIVALVKLANEQDRVVSVVRFESVCYEPIEIHPKEDIDQLIRLLVTSPTNGGTKFQAPLEKARDIIEQDADYSEADIVFITDGIAPLSSVFLQDYSESLEKLKTNFFLLEIEPEWGWSSELRKLASQSWVINAEGNFDELGAVFTAC